MPYTRIIPQIAEAEPRLTEELAEELLLEAAAGRPPDAPYIIEEQFRHNNRLMVTVVWDKWSEIDKETRGHIILDAYKRVRGEEQMLLISIALGLTHREAAKIGVELPVSAESPTFSVGGEEDWEA